ncbi:MAG TPA: hypothetical protein ENG51_05035 [Deltaproteobacteria bacterium]|nr:hypothetical protein [Deltaproteobacteria bacterium]
MARRKNFYRDCQIAKLMVSGRSSGEVATLFGISQSRVHQITHKMLRIAKHPSVYKHVFNDVVLGTNNRFNVGEFLEKDFKGGLDRIRRHKKIWLDILTNMGKRNDNPWQPPKKKVLQKRIVIPRGTIFTEAKGLAIMCHSDVYTYAFGLTANTAGDILYGIDPNDPEIENWFVDLD